MGSRSWPWRSRAEVTLASQRDYNIGAAAVMRLLTQNIHDLVKPTAAEIIARAVVDAVDADRDKQKAERDN